MGIYTTSTGYTLQGAEGALTKLIMEGMRTGVQPSTVSLDELRGIIAEAKSHEAKEIKLATKKKAAKRARTRKSLFSDEGTSLADLRGSAGLAPKMPPSMVPHDTKAWVDFDKKPTAAEILETAVETKEVLKERLKEVSDEDAIAAFCETSEEDSDSDPKVFKTIDGSPDRDYDEGTGTLADIGEPVYVDDLHGVPGAVLYDGADISISTSSDAITMPAHGHLFPSHDHTWVHSTPSVIMTDPAVLDGLPARLDKMETQIEGIYTLLHDITKKLK